MTTSQRFVLGFHPSSQGFGHLLLEDGNSPFDWAVTSIRKDKNSRALARLEKLLAKYKPAELALEAYDGNTSKRSARTRALCRAAVVLAKKHKIRVRLLTRSQLGKALSLPATATREEYAAAVAERLPVLRPDQPLHRRAWENERRTMPMFCAAACALAGYSQR